VVYNLSDTNPFLLEIVESEILGEGSAMTGIIMPMYNFVS
jgi:hypothetical protein